MMRRTKFISEAPTRFILRIASIIVLISSDGCFILLDRSSIGVEMPVLNLSMAMVFNCLWRTIALQRSLELLNTNLVLYL